MCKVRSSLGQKWGNERAITGSNIILTCPLRGNLLKRGHSISDINNEFQKVTQLTQNDLLFKEHPNETTNNILPFVITYDETNKLIGPILKKHWNIITEEQSLQNL